MAPTNINGQICQKKTEITVPELYCGQEYDNKHAWKDLQVENDEYRDYSSKQMNKISTIQYIPGIPVHNTDVRKVYSKVIKPPPEYQEVRKNDDYYPKVWTPQQTTEHLPHTTYHNSTIQDEQTLRPTITTKLVNDEKKQYARITVTSQPDTTKETNKEPKQDREQEYADINKKIEKFTFFWSNSSLFSQHFLATFQISGTTYSSAEQYMMQQKALLFGDLKTADLIMITKCPKEQKRLGPTVCGFNQSIWDKYSMAIVRQGNYNKLNQKPRLLNKLHATLGKTLVGASPHDFTWGTSFKRE